MNKETEDKVIEHGRNLINAFKIYDCDPLKLCRALRRLENKAQAITIRMCNIGESQEDLDELDKIAKQVITLLNPNGFDVPIFINTDPRGYALKIDDEFMRKGREGAFNKIPLDMGGYGIIAPDLTL